MLLGNNHFLIIFMSDQENMSRGRPRQFNIDDALDQAMQVFRSQGYHSTSMSELCQAMDLTVGSIYKAFGDKPTLFAQVFGRYLSLRNQALNARLKDAENGFQKIQILLQFYINSVQDIEGKRGCLVVGSAIEIEVLNQQLAQAVESALKKNLSNIKQFIEEGKQDGSIGKHLNTDTAASLLLCLVLGIRVAGKISSTSPNDSILSLIMSILN